MITENYLNDMLAINLHEIKINLGEALANGYDILSEEYKQKLNKMLIDILTLETEIQSK